MLTPTGAERSTPKHSPSRNQWRATLRRCHRTWRATLRGCHLEGNAPSLPPHLEGNAPSLPPHQGRDDLRVVHTWRATLRRCHRMGGMTSASSASVAASSPALAPLVWSSPALAALVWSIPSLHRPGYSCHAISKSRSPASSALPVVRRAAHNWAPGTPPFASLRPSAISALSRCRAVALRPLRSPKRKHLHVTRCTRLSRLLHLRLRRFPPVNVLARTSHAVSFWSTATPVHSLGQSRSATDICN